MKGRPFKKGHIPWNKGVLIKKFCKICSSPFEIEPYRKNTAFFCSRKCVGKNLIPWNKGIKTGLIPWNKGTKGLVVISKEQRIKISKSLKGMPHPWINNQWRKGKPRLDFRGKNHPMWKGGVSKANRTERYTIMNTIEYKLWREAIFKRDSFTCRSCGDIGGVLNADHIKPFAIYPELRFAIDNGQTLCRDCHILKTRADKMIYFNYKEVEVN